MKVNVVKYHIRVILANEQIPGITTRYPIDMEGSVIYVEPYCIAAENMLKDNDILPLICDASQYDRASVFVRWDNDKKEWYESGSLTLRSTRLSRCISVWTKSDGIKIDERPYSELKLQMYEPSIYDLLSSKIYGDFDLKIDSGSNYVVTTHANSASTSYIPDLSTKSTLRSYDDSVKQAEVVVAPPLHKAHKSISAAMNNRLRNKTDRRALSKVAEVGMREEKMSYGEWNEIMKRNTHLRGKKKKGLKSRSFGDNKIVSSGRIPAGMARAVYSDEKRKMLEQQYNATPTPYLRGWDGHQKKREDSRNSRPAVATNLSKLERFRVDRAIKSIAEDEFGELI